MRSLYAEFLHLLVVGSAFFDVQKLSDGSRSAASESGKFPPKIPIVSNCSPLDQKKSQRVGSKNTRVKGGSTPYLLRV